jgi:hypothetical protein
VPVALPNAAECCWLSLASLSPGESPPTTSPGPSYWGLGCPSYINRGQCVGTLSDGCGLVWGTSPLLVKKKNGSYPAFMHKQCNKVDLQVFVFARQLSYCTYLGIQFEAKTGRSSIFQNVPWCSVPTDSCGSDRINQVLYRQEGSKTFRDFPRGLRDLL